MLLVSAYYDIPSKAPSSFYRPHLRRFFKMIGDRELLFFTSEELLPELQFYAKSAINTRFVTRPFEAMEIFQTFPIEYWMEHIKLDPYPGHTWQVGAIWANKMNFARKALEMRPEYEWAMWIDAGCIRKDEWAPYVSDFLKRSVAHTLSPGVYFQLLNALPTDKDFFVHPEVYIAGALIAFHKAYINDFINEYHRVASLYNQRRLSHILDQYVFATLSKYLTYVKTIQYDGRPCPDNWFFFLAYF